MEKLTREQIEERVQQTAGWSLVDNTIEREFVFKNFLRAMWFVNAVGYIAEAMNHHPDFIIHYNHVTLKLWTHDASGLTERDFLLAKKINAMQMEEMK